MKKSVLALALAFGVTTAFAQDLTSKKGEPILPEAGDWGISTDATPFLNYAGNFFGKSAFNSAPTFNFLASNSIIVGKYFKDEKTAYRAGINIGFSKKSASNLVDQDNFTGTGANPKVTDKTSVSNTGFGITAGLEKRKGKTRLQGYYGGELGLYFGSTHQKNTYGNIFGNAGTAGTSMSPTSTTWATGSNTVSGSGATASRVTDYKSGTTMQFGLRGFVGVEYFVLPKMSLGGEFGWGLGWTHQGAGQTITESPNTAFTGAQTTTAKTGTSGSLAIGTDNNNSFFGPSGSLRMNFYF